MMWCIVERLKKKNKVIQNFRENFDIEVLGVED